MSSRERILQLAAQNKPEGAPLPDVSFLEKNSAGSLEKFAAMLQAVGGTFYCVNSYAEILSLVKQAHPGDGRLYSTIPEINTQLEQENAPLTFGHALADVDVAIIKAHFGVAENGAVWITDDLLPHRVLPFITQHLAVIIDKGVIHPTLHEAYRHLAGYSYNYAAFIAGPSKTADIEQSLVVGAHGSRSMTVFVMENCDI